MNTVKWETKTRNSSIELVRLLAMFMIVLYHLILFFIEPVNSDPIYKAIQIPLHIGVILFVLISGYFGINPTFRGFFKITCIVAVYFLPLRLWYVYKMEMGGMAMLDSFHVLSKTPYWFVRTYLCLYLISPFINKCLKDITFRERLYYIVVFAIIAVYLGMLQCDITLIDGKNIANFILIYIIGDTIRKEHNRWKQFSNLSFVLCFLFFNVVLVTLYIACRDTVISDMVWNWSFPYYSPFLLVSSVLFFIPFTRFTIHSRFINYVAVSVFSIYVIHHQPTILDKCMRPVVNTLYSVTNENVWECLGMLIVFAVFVMIISVTIDKLLSPLWHGLDTIGKTISERIDKFIFPKDK
jgi:surface polysaccharide O-acyltransferase-like enzyme